ncbi:uncharacterized protein MYCGRDRAFT_44189, partial [Zymoseptoria tritici IPO323]
GITIDKVVLDFSIGRKDLALFYIAASRVKRLEDVLFKRAFDFNRLTGTSGEGAVIRAADYSLRQAQVLARLR